LKLLKGNRTPSLRVRPRTSPRPPRRGGSPAPPGRCTHQPGLGGSAGVPPTPRRRTRPVRCHQRVGGHRGGRGPRTTDAPPPSRRRGPGRRLARAAPARPTRVGGSARRPDRPDRPPEKEGKRRLVRGCHATRLVTRTKESNTYASPGTRKFNGSALPSRGGWRTTAQRKRDRAGGRRPSGRPARTAGRRPAGVVASERA